jgi:protoporphyrinogen oxidase
MGISVVILGAGPAGLGAAWKLAKRGGFDVTVVERNTEVGGNAASFPFAGMQVDFGSHRLHPSCAPEILDDIRSMLGDDLLDRPRHGRIRLRGKWVGFPLKFANLVSNLPVSFTLGALADTLKKFGKKAETQTFADVLEQGLGRTICRDFYFPYAKKIWGVAPEELDREQARRRVAAGSVWKLVRKVLGSVPGLRAKAGQRFYYPRNGFGAISEAYAKAAVQAGARILRETTVSGIETMDGRVTAVHCTNADGMQSLPAQLVLSTIPVTHLVRTAVPDAPKEVMQSACALKFRSMILVYLAIEAEQFTEFDAHYFPGSDVTITRLSEPKHYGLSAPAGTTILCAELPCSTSDPVWRASDRELANVMIQSLAASGLPSELKIREVTSRRLPQAYPIYTSDYGQHFDRVDRWANNIDGLVTFGRQGLFAHDNTHHTLAMAYALNKCLNDAGTLDHVRWAAHRREFEQHIVED